MKKVLKKSVEAEISSVLKNFFHQKDEYAAKKIEKSVNKVSRSLSKEFIKQVTKLKKAKAKKLSDSKKDDFQISKSDKLYGVPEPRERSDPKNAAPSETEPGNVAKRVPRKRSTRSGTAARRSSSAKRAARKDS